MSRKIDSSELQLGMYVSELDRPWTETPFLFQGFSIRTTNELSALHECCEFVYVDEEKSISKPETGATQYRQQTSQTSEKKHPAYSVSIEEELNQAREIRDVAKTHMANLINEARLGKSINTDKTTTIVSDLVESLIRNPDAMVLLGMIKRHEKEAEEHVINSSILAMTLARYLKMPRHEIEEIGLAALLHDIGETAIPLELLTKGPKTNAEKRQLQQHTKLGAFLLNKIDGMPRSVIDAALQHHEQIDGNGYPKGLKGDEISRVSKLIAIINVYERITNSSSGPKLPPSEALRYLYLYRDRVFDSELTESFIRCLGVYPIGSIVELANGEVGIVVSTPPEDHLHPRLLLVRNSSKQPIEPPRIMNLSLFVKQDPDKYTILHLHPPGSYDIDTNAYLGEYSIL